MWSYNHRLELFLFIITWHSAFFELLHPRMHIFHISDTITTHLTQLLKSRKQKIICNVYVSILSTRMFLTQVAATCTLYAILSCHLCYTFTMSPLHLFSPVFMCCLTWEGEIGDFRTWMHFVYRLQFSCTIMIIIVIWKELFFQIYFHFNTKESNE
jgi:hypothetical protein